VYAIADDLVVIAETEDDLITRSPADAMGGRPYCPQSYKYNHAVRI